MPRKKTQKMMFKKGICSCHGLERYIVNVKYQLCSVGVHEKNKDKRKPPKPINKISKKQTVINSNYKAMLSEYDKTMPKVCLGCGKKDDKVILSHSHIISRADCHRYNLKELIYDKNNIQYLCMSMGDNHTGCHVIWESKKRNTLLCYNDNMEYIKSISEELYNKYVV